MKDRKIEDGHWWKGKCLTQGALKILLKVSKQIHLEK